MEARCKICGTSTKLTKAHKDYQNLARQPSYPYICEKCSAWIQFEMQKHKEFRKTK